MIFLPFNTGSYKGCSGIATEIPVVGGQILKFVRPLIISSFSTDCIEFLALIKGDRPDVRWVKKIIRAQRSREKNNPLSVIEPWEEAPLAETHLWIVVHT